MEIVASPDATPALSAAPPVGTVTDAIRVYRMQTDRLSVLESFVTPFGPLSVNGPLQDGAETAGVVDVIRAARELAVCSAFEAIRRIADAS